MTITFKEIDYVEDWYQKIQEVAKWTLFQFYPESEYSKYSQYDLFIDGQECKGVFPEREISVERAIELLQSVDFSSGKEFIVKCYKRYPVPGVFITHPDFKKFYTGTYAVIVEE